MLPSRRKTISIATAFSIQQNTYTNMSQIMPLHTIDTFVRITVPPQRETREIALKLAVNEDKTISLCGPTAVKYTLWDGPSDSIFLVSHSRNDMKYRIHLDTDVPRQATVRLIISLSQK